MTIHKDLPTTELHEPKGAKTANSGEVYVADGVSSGVFKKLEASNVSLLDSDGHLDATNLEAGIKELVEKAVGGWGYYKDSGSTDQVLSTTYQALSINKLSSSTYEGKLPFEIRGSGTLWSSTSNSITPINQDDCYILRINLPIITKSGTPQELTLLVDIGGSTTPTNIIVEKRIPIDNVAPYSVTTSIPIFCRSTFLANGGQIFVKTDSGTTTINGSAIFIQRTYNGLF